jgi:hypothetical protein
MKILTMLIFTFLSVNVIAGEFSGELLLFPKDCQKTNARICKLEGLLTYKSSRNSLVWQTDEWTDDNLESGTTDGASIPSWAQPIIGDPYDPSYLKAAIVHDHYCYKENRVRPWRETHRMFYDALVDLGVDSTKAKIMYFAVYLGGPKWVKLVPGQNCGTKCIKNFSPKSERWDGDQYGSVEFQAALKKASADILKKPSITLEEIEVMAKNTDPSNFFFKHGDTYKPKGKNDPNVFPQM